MEERYTVEFYSQKGQVFKRKFVLDPTQEQIDSTKRDFEQKHNTKIISFCILGPNFLYED